MPLTTRELLDELGRDTLVRLMRDRGLAPTRENDDRRAALARSYRGDVEALILDLTRQELVDIFSKISFDYRDEEVHLSNPSKYRHDELQAFAIRAFADRRVHIPADFTPVPPDEDDEDEDDDEDVEDDDDAASFDEEDVTAAEALGVDSTEWSRPRMIARILEQLGEEVPQRLRTSRFQELISSLAEEGVEACFADDYDPSVLTGSEDSPGIDAKLRLRLRGGRVRDVSVPSAAPKSMPAPRPVETGGPAISVMSGERPVPVQVSRPSDYKLAVLKLQFLTAVPSAERGSLAAWPGGYLAAATRGLTLREQETALLRAFAAGLCIGNHSPYDAIPPLSQVLSQQDWGALIADFRALNPFQPELVQAIVSQVAPVQVAPAASPASVVASLPADFLQEPAPALVSSMAASSRASSAEADTERTEANNRDLGALAGMFDDE